MDWFEAISENYMDSGGRPITILEQIRARYSIGLHGVALSIGSVDPLNQRYLQRLKTLVERIQPAIVSDHLCWSGAGGDQLHDLLPLPFTEESIQHVAFRVSQVQDFLKRPILLENVSTYVTFKHSAMPEWEFLSEVARRSGCGILLDLNNIYVNSKNHGFDPYDYLNGIPGDRIGQFHMSGHTDMGTYLFDTHSKPAIEPVWNLYRDALRRWGQITTLVEWDEDIPEWDGLVEECDRAKKIYQEYQNRQPAAAAKQSVVSYHSHPAARQKSLREIQEWMKSRIQPAGHQTAGESVLNPQGGAAGEERLSVYAGGYVARAYEGMKEVYEAVHQILGDQRFIDLAENYARRYPSHDYNLGLIGRHLPEFLEIFPVEGFPYLADLARLEWRIAESFHAFDDQPFDRSQLAQIPVEAWENARLTFQSSVHLFISEWPVLDLWKDRKALDPKTQVAPKKQYLLVGRKGLQVRCEMLDEKQYRFLEILLSGQTLGEACDTLAETSGDEEIPIGEWFARWVQDGLIARCEISGSTTAEPAPSLS